MDQLSPTRKLLLLLQFMVGFLVLYVTFDGEDEARLPDDLHIHYVRDVKLKMESKRLTYEKTYDFRNLGLSKGKWLKHFPELFAMVQEIESLDRLPLFAETTDPSKTKLSVKGGGLLTEGSNLVAHIEAKDYHNRAKRYGGDYFRAILYRTKVKGDAVSCTVTDKTDGTYKVMCPLVWKGVVSLKVTLINPSEIVYLLMANTNRISEPYLILNNSFRNTRGKLEYGICDLSLKDRFSNEEICDHTHPINNEPWFCTKPRSGECNAIEEQMDKIILKEASVLIGGNDYFKDKQKYNKQIRNSGLKRTIKGASEKSELDFFDREYGHLPICSTFTAGHPVSDDPKSASGAVVNGKWRSLHCDNSQGSNHTLRGCLEGKNVFVLGDSTVLMWFRHMVGSFRAGSQMTNNENWSEPRFISLPEMDTELYYRSHGPPFHGRGPPSSRPYITDTFDGIEDNGRENIILFSIGIHYGKIHPDLYIRRLEAIKASILRLLQRIPNTRIFVIGLHSNRAWVFQSTPWIPYRHEILKRKVFNNIPGVTYLTLWDMLEVMGNETPHPPEKYVASEIRLFLAYAC